MGSWGCKALESDEGLDVVDFFEEYIPEHTNLQLIDILKEMKEEGFFGETFEEADYLSDNSAMALAELYFMYLDFGKMEFGEEDTKEGETIFGQVQSFSADRESLAYIRRYLTDVRDEVPDAEGDREINQLWRESGNWDEWSNHLEYLLSRLDKEILKQEQ